MQEILEKQNPWWFGKKYDAGVPRLIYYPMLLKYTKTPEILLILGARRTGKSTLLYQIIDTLEAPRESILFMNLDEPFFQARRDDPAFLSEIIEEYITKEKQDRYYIFLDEIQNNRYCIEAIKTLYDTDKRLKFILTGSTSSILEKKVITRLSGRYLISTIYPLTLKEFMEFRNLKNPTTGEIKQETKEYIKYGAFPRIVLEKDDEIKEQILKNYYETIYLKDIIFPHKLRNNKEVFNLLYFILSNIGKLHTYNSIADTLGISTDTVKEYLSYAEEAYLLYTVNKFDYSVKKQIVNPKKIYCLDTGLLNYVSFRFSENTGRLLENTVFMSLKRRGYDVYYYKDTHECDFLIKDKNRITQAIQVTTELKEDNRKREISGLISAMKAHNLKEGLILTENEEGVLEIERSRIIIKPVFGWLLE